MKRITLEDGTVYTLSDNEYEELAAADQLDHLANAITVETL